MVSAFAPFSSYLLLIAGAFCFSFLASGLLLSLIQQRLKGAHDAPPQLAALLAARPLALLVFIMIEAAAFLMLSRYEAFLSSPLLVFSLLLGAALLLLISLLPQSGRYQSTPVAACLLFIACLCLVLYLPDDMRVFDANNTFLIDRLFCLLFVFSAGLMFLQFEKVDGSGITAFVVLGFAFLAIPSLIYLIGLFNDVSGAIPGLPVAPHWPRIWYDIGLLLVGIGLGMLAWSAYGYELRLGLEGRLAIGFLFAFFVLQLAVLSSPYVALALFGFYITCYVLVPLIGRLLLSLKTRLSPLRLPYIASLSRLGGRLLAERGWPALSFLLRPIPPFVQRAKLILEQLIVHLFFMLLAAFAYFWPLPVIVLGIGAALCMLFWSRLRRS